MKIHIDGFEGSGDAMAGPLSLLICSCVNRRRFQESDYTDSIGALTNAD